MITGTMVLKQGGEVLATLAGVTLDTGGMEREAVIANGAPQDFREKPVAPMVKAKIMMDESFTLDTIRNFKGDIVIECDNGLVFQIDGGWCSKPPSLGDTGEADTEWSGKRCRQV